MAVPTGRSIDERECGTALKNYGTSTFARIEDGL